MANTAFLLLITISGLIGSDPTSYYSSPSIWSDQLISGPHFSLLHGNFKRNAISPSSWISDFSNDLTSLTSNQTRFKRNADSLSDYSGKLSTVARISNGISLLAGLTDGKSPIDTIIEELLHFGKVKLSEVVALQKDKVEAMLKEVKTVQGNLDTSPDVKILEENTIVMSRVRQVFIESDFGSFQIPTDYFSEAQSLKDDTTTDYSVIESATKAVTDALEKVKKLENPPAVLDSTNYVDYLSPIVALRTGIASGETAPASFANVVQKLESLSKLNDGEAILKPVQQMLDLVVSYSNLLVVKVTDAGKAGKNMDTITSFSSKLATTAQSNFPVLSGFVSSQINPRPVNRQFTAGFPNGVADLKKLMKDILDPAVESTVGTGKNFGRLSGGLKPLMDWSAKLEASESALKPIATSEILQSARNAAHLQTLLNELVVSSSDAEAVAKVMIDNKPDPVSATKVDDMINLIENARKLTKDLAYIKSSSLVFPPAPQEVADVKTILEDLPPKNDHNDVQTVINKLKDVPEKVKATTEYLSKLQELLKGVPDPAAIRQAADHVSQSESNLKSFKDEIETDVAPKLTKLKDSTEPIDSVVRALRACQIIKDFKKEDGTNINAALDTIAKAAPLIKDLQKKPSTRKKRQSDDVQELVKLKDAQKTSAALGSASITISSMAQLKGLEGSVQNLKTSTIFDTEVAKVKDDSKKSEILKKWGDHTAFTSSLDSTINQIKTFGAKLSVDKDLRKLGAHLNDAKAVGDVKQNIAEKSEAVEILILETSDTTAKADLQALKTQLDTLAALDLQFSNHHSAFPDVQGALKSFFDFVTGFVTPKKQSSQAAAAAAAADTGLNIWMYALIGASVLGLFALVGCLSWYFYRKHNRDTIKSWEEIKKFILKNYYSNLPQAIGFARGLMNEMDKEVGELKKKTKDPKKMRYNNLEVLMDTAVCLPDGRFINANWIKAQGGAQYIATQGPLEEVLAEDGKTVLKADTRADFLYMIVVHKSEFVVQLCDWVEEREDDDIRKARLERERQEDEDAQKIANEEERDRQLLELGTRRHNEYCARNYEKAGKYYDPGKGYSVTCGQYTVTTDKVEKGKRDGALEIRHLTITDSTDKTVKHKFTHLFHNDWPDHSVPDDIEPVIEAVKKVNQSKKPIIVHCSAGIGRTVSLIAADVLARDIERHPWMRAAEMLKILRMSRYKGIQSATQCFFAFLCAIRLLIDQYGKSDPKSKEIWDNHLKVFNNVKDKMCDEDLKEKRRVQAEQKDPPKKMDNKPKKSNNKKKTTGKTEKSQQVDSVETSSSATTPQTTGGKGNGTPMGTPKSRGKGGADHVVIPMESGSEEE